MVSNSGKGELGSSSLSWGFDEKENESKAAKLKSPAKGSKNFMSMTISAFSKIAQSRKKKILVERNDPVMEPKETVPVDGLPSVTKIPKRVTFSEASLNSESLSDTSGIASLDADPSLPPYDPKTNYLSRYTILSSMAVSFNKKSPSPLSIRSFPPHPRTSENNNSTHRRSFNGNPFSRPSVLATHRGFNPVKFANSHADSTRMVSDSGEGELGSFSLSWGFDEKENESKAGKRKSPAKGSKNFMSMTISASSKISQSGKKKILVERNDPIRTSITLSNGKATFFSANSEEHNQNSEKVMEPKETFHVDGFPPITKTPKRVTFSEASLNSESLSDTPAIASLDADPSLPPYDPKTNYLSWYTTLSSMAVSSNNKYPSTISVRSFPPHPRTSENNNSTPIRSFNGNPFLRHSVLGTHRGFNPVTPANSHANSTRMVSNFGKGELGTFSLSWGFDEKENESKVAKLKSPAKGSKIFMSLMISASSKIAQS
ncbi:hypothetical protein FXO37_29612 [Capsicum annuum]|nr:hypothetical protein FXO37_29612 [Capsicum annuum]